MALVYEQLFQSESLVDVRMKEYLPELTESLMDAFDARRRVELTVECADLILDVSAAMPCGLIVTELLSDASKLAFPPSFQGVPHLLVSLIAHNDYCELVVRDNGVGLPGETDWQTQRSMGLKLVKLWVTHQMGGTLELERDSGTAFHIIFRKNG